MGFGLVRSMGAASLTSLKVSVYEWFYWEMSKIGMNKEGGMTKRGSYQIYRGD